MGRPKKKNSNETSGTRIGGRLEGIRFDPRCEIAGNGLDACLIESDDSRRHYVESVHAWRESDFHFRDDALVRRAGTPSQFSANKTRCLSLFLSLALFAFQPHHHKRSTTHRLLQQGALPGSERSGRRRKEEKEEHCHHRHRRRERGDGAEAVAPLAALASSSRAVSAAARGTAVACHWHG